MHPPTAASPTAIEARTLVDLLRARAAADPRRVAFTFLRDGEQDAAEIDYGTLDRRARAIAASLQTRTRPGDRALLLHADALAFITAFCGCLYAGAIAVPAYPPRVRAKDRPSRTDERLRAVLLDARPAAALAAGDLVRALIPITQQDPAWADVAWIASDVDDEDGEQRSIEREAIDGALAARWQPPAIGADDIAFLQYTSGSTSTPRGVMVSHANVLHNQRALHDAFAQSSTSTIVGWLPLYHDMGLIGNVLHTLYLGAHAVLMPPVAFLQRPVRWLQAIGRYRATISGGPNFAYDLCARRVADEDRRTLDLSSWDVAFNGAEPVRTETLDRFAAAFASCGFRRTSFHPCYGLAEATLMVTAARLPDRGAAEAPTVRTFLRDALEAGRAVECGERHDAPHAVPSVRALVGCGVPDPSQPVLIVDPATRRRCAPGEIGEIWLTGPNVTHGYWNNVDESARVFGARRDEETGDAVNDGRTFLRTGDLGVLHDGELFVTGRVKDLIILRGRNLHPQDLEATAERSHPALRSGCGVACSVDVDSEEQLVLVHEVRAGLDAAVLDAVCAAIRQALAQEHDVAPYAIALVAPGRVPKTSSGKLQRQRCRAQFLAGDLDTLSVWSSSASIAPAESFADASSDRDRMTRELITRLARIARTPAASLDGRTSLAALGLDSLRAAECQADLERTFGARVDQAVLLDGPTIDEVVTLILTSRSTPVPAAATSETTPVADADAEARLSRGQRALWFLQQMAPQSAAYHIARAGVVRGRLRVDALERAFLAVIERHHALQTTVAPQGEPRGETQPAGVDVAQIDAADWHGSDVLDALVAESTRPFDLARGPLARVRVLTRSPQDHVLLFVIHHIAADLWSLTQMMRELGVQYAAQVSGLAVTLPPLELSYAGYVRWLDDWMSGPDAAQAREYWRQTLSDVPPLDLPIDRLRPPVQTFRGAAERTRLAAPVAGVLADLARAHGATLQMALLAAFQTLLGRYAAQDRFAVASPAAARPSAALQGVVGYLVNPLPIAADLTGRPSFVGLLARVRRTVTGALRHQLYPFDAIVDALHVSRDPSRQPLAQVMFVFQAAPGSDEDWTLLALGEAGAQVDIGGLALTSIAIPETTAQFELSLAAAYAAGVVHLVWTYNTDLFDAETIRRMADSFTVLIDAIAVNSTAALVDLPLLSEAERATILEAWNDTDTPYPADALLHRLIEAQAERTPSATALVSGVEAWTYAELLAKTHRLARALRARGVGPDAVVGVCMERSPDLVFALLAILTAGGAYLPLDPDHPADRLRVLLREAAPRLVLTHARTHDRVPDEHVDVYDIDALLVRASGGNGADDVATAAAQDPDHLAYVIYTSGSTGVPKGVTISHRAICNRLFWMQDAYGLGPGDAVLQKTTYTFDVSVWELFWPLMTGARLVLAGPDDHRDSARLVALIGEHAITTIHFVPSMLQAFVAEPGVSACTSLVRVICSGEALPSDLARQCAAMLPGAAVHNLYGPTEAAVDVTAWPASAEADDSSPGPTVPIGRPIANTRIYLLDRALQVVPVGVPGDLYIGGRNLARGYRHQPALTADRFVPNPFARGGGDAEDDSRLYRTGDLARARADGAIEFLGRRDDQVKVRGFRIELADVEAALARVPGVQDCAVALRAAGAGLPRLIGYIVSPSPDLSLAALRRALMLTLPEYMVPQRFVRLDALPLTSSGKLNRRALPAPPRDREDADEQSDAPLTPAEEALAAVWARVLDVDRVRASDNFFERGGDSIRALQVLSLARERGLAITLAQIFQHQTLAALAQAAGAAAATSAAASEAIAPFALLREADRAALPAIDGIEDAYPLTQLQAALVFHSEYQQDYVIYCVSADLRAPFDEEAMREAMAGVIARHPMLRTSYELAAASEPVQIVHASAPVPLTVEDLGAWAEDEQDTYLAGWLDREKRRPFDWAVAPLFRVHMHRRGDARVQFNLSHPLLDGWSTASLITELFERYFARLAHRQTADRMPEAGPLTTTYRDFVALERQALASDETRAYWRRLLESGAQGDLPRWPAPPRSATTLPVRYTFPVAQDVLDGVKRAARLAAVPLKSALIAVHARVLAAAIGEPDVLTGSIANGRVEGPDGDRVIGLFLNTLPLRLTIGDETWLDLLRRVFAAERDALPHRRYPFAELQRLNGGRPPFETAINIINFHVYDRLRHIGGLELLHRSTSYDQTFFPLTSYFELDVFSSTLLVHLDSNTPDLGDAQLDAMGGYYLRALQDLARDPTRRPLDTSVMTPEDEARLLIAFNDTAMTVEPCVIHELFERQVERRPTASAVRTASAPLTYAELNARANQLARHLRACGVRHDDLVGLCVERTEQAAIGMLGIMKAGAAYVPLDPAFPPDRLALIAQDAGFTTLVTQSSLVDRVSVTSSGAETMALLRPVALTRIALDADVETLASYSPANLSLAIDPASRAYVIYTSGSTGRPKGVEIAHANVANVLASFRRELAFTETDVLPAITTFSFDISVLELFLPLTTGAELVLVDRADAANAERLADIVRTAGVTVMQATPSTWRLLIDSGWRGSRRLRAISGGEALPRELAARLKDRCPRVRNVYGPTETTVWSTSGLVTDAEGPVSIGRPIANTRIYVLDRGLRPQAVGVPGRLFIGGRGVARGYLRRPALTAERFVPDPFCVEPGARLYDTGDRARVLPDGTIEFLGRADAQIKVRGFRIEPAEIEAALMQYPGVRQAAVIAREYGAGDMRLLASVVCAPDTVPDWADVRRVLLTKLPEYMVPAGFARLDALPLTPNGKIHRQALASATRVDTAIAAAYEAPRTPLERQLAAIWASVLHVPAVGLRDSFFALGGHSLLAMQVVSRVRARVEPRLPLSALFEAPTLAQFADAVARVGVQIL